MARPLNYLLLNDNTLAIKTLESRHDKTGYGMTEAGAVFVPYASKSDEHQMSFAGAIMNHTEVKIINENGDTVPFGTPGNACYRSHATTKQYYNDENATKSNLTPDNWIISGDRCILYEDGYAKIIGRIKDTIIRGGENIEPSEVENFLINHPQITDAQVFAVYDERLIEEVAASIIKVSDSNLSKEDVKEFCSGKLAHFKIPKYIEFVDEFPRFTFGKVKKSELRKNMEDKYNLVISS